MPALFSIYCAGAIAVASNTAAFADFQLSNDLSVEPLTRTASRGRRQEEGRSYEMGIRILRDLSK